MGEPKNPHFYDFWIFGHAPEPQNHLLLSLERLGHLNKSWKILGSFLKYYFVNFKKSKHNIFVDIGKDARRAIPPNRLINS